MRRLWLCYREACNLEIFSEAGRGTEIVITFPVSGDYSVGSEHSQAGVTESYDVK